MRTRSWLPTEENPTATHELAETHETPLSWL